MIKTTVMHFKELGYTVEAIAEPYEVHYKIYKITSSQMQHGFESHAWRRAGGDDEVQLLQDAEVFISGTVKQDGYSEWSLKHNEDDVFWACTSQQLTDIGTIMATCHTMTKDLCGDWLLKC